MIDSDAEQDRARFRAAVGSTVHAVRDADHDQTRDQASDVERIAAPWAERGQLQELLEPVLGDPDPAVRLSAASILLENGDTDLALPVLDNLRADTGPIADDAELMVGFWRQERQRRSE